MVFPLVAHAAETAGQRLPTTAARQETSAEIMARQAAAPPRRPRPDRELEWPDRSRLPQNPDAPEISQYPPADPGV
ncbi:MAG: hypothetical protein IPH99_10180 [Xanthomonadales bacterium]|nr:hypothetical protein [Xanthomonadales bacterium]